MKKGNFDLFSASSNENSLKSHWKGKSGVFSKHKAKSISVKRKANDSFTEVFGKDAPFPNKYVLNNVFEEFVNFDDTDAWNFDFSIDSLPHVISPDLNTNFYSHKQLLQRASELSSAITEKNKELHQEFLVQEELKEDQEQLRKIIHYFMTMINKTRRRVYSKRRSI